MVFGRILYPMPEASGPALAALGGRSPLARVELGLDYLERAAQRSQTPQALGWGILALSVWGRRPAPRRGAD